MDKYWNAVCVILLMISASGCKATDYLPFLKDKILPANVPSLTDSEKSKRNAELLQEMIRVIQMGEPENAEMFGGLVNSLNQDASIEGTYNGLIHNHVYRRKEESSGPASNEALKIFVDQLVIFNTGKPGVQRGDLDLAFRQTSVWGMKRILGDEAIKFLREFKDRTALARWYGPWAVSMGTYGADFGLKLRHEKNAEFHEKWALSATQDALDWEVLNRLHRALNHANSK